MDSLRNGVAQEGRVEEKRRPGLEIVHRRVGVGTRRQADGAIAETESSVAEQYDVGRLYQVRENDGRNPLAANYRYDVGGRLVDVELDPDSGSKQNRSFSCDLRGFLVSETHPEAGTTDYIDLGARGHATP
ncbi:MAG: hypothetical protein AAGN66_27435 [Acidobacteriota bacterium]